MLQWQPTTSCRYETLGADTSNSRGTHVTGDAAANTKGAWTNLGSATSFDYHMLHVTMSIATSSNNGILDIGISYSGNRYILVPDLRVPGGKNVRSGGASLALPLYIPAGSQLSCRSAQQVGSQHIVVCLTGGSSGFYGSPGFAKMIRLYTPTASRGTDLDPTVADTKTAWTEIAASSSDRIDGLLCFAGPADEYTRAVARYYLVDFGTGAAASEVAMVANLHQGQDQALDVPLPYYFGPFPCHFPAATRFAARCQTDDVAVTSRKLDIAMWGFVA